MEMSSKEIGIIMQYSECNNLSYWSLISTQFSFNGFFSFVIYWFFFLQNFAISINPPLSQKKKRNSFSLRYNTPKTLFLLFLLSENIKWPKKNQLEIRENNQIRTAKIMTTITIKIIKFYSPDFFFIFFQFYRNCFLTVMIKNNIFKLCI